MENLTLIVVLLCTAGSFGIGTFVIVMLLLFPPRDAVHPSLAAPLIFVAALFFFGSVALWTSYRVSMDEEELRLVSLLATRRIPWRQVNSYRYLGPKWLHGSSLLRPADETKIWVLIRYLHPNRQEDRVATSVFWLPAVESDFLRVPGEWVTLLDVYIPERRRAL